MHSNVIDNCDLDRDEVQGAFVAAISNHRIRQGLHLNVSMFRAWRCLGTAVHMIR